MRLYIIRHADPDYANDTITAHGHAEARALADRLRDVKIDHLYTSPLGRARATADYTAQIKGQTPEVLDWTAEPGHWRIDQPHEKGAQVCVWDVHGHRVRACLPLPSHHDWHTVHPFDNPLFRTEYDQICQHSDELLAQHGYVRDQGVYRIDRRNREALAVFCHGGFGLIWLSHLLAIPLPSMFVGFFLPPTSVTTVLFDEREQDVAVPRCIGLGDISHLYAADLHRLRVPMGIRANYE